jgi:hypothetical protein
MAVSRCGSCLRERAVKEDGLALGVASRAELLASEENYKRLGRLRIAHAER